MGALLGELSSADNAVRSAAEARLEAVPAPQRAVAFFEYAAGGGGDAEARGFALVLLRRLLSSSWEEVQSASGSRTRSWTGRVLRCGRRWALVGRRS